MIFLDFIINSEFRTASIQMIQYVLTFVNNETLRIALGKLLSYFFNKPGHIKIVPDAIHANT